MGKISGWTSRWFRRSSAGRVRLIDLSASKHGGAAEPESVKGLRVLLIDDSQQTRDLFAGTLRHYEAQVTAVDSARAALNVLDRLRPHVVVTNCALDLADGYALMRMLRTLEVEDKRRIPTIALTAYAEAKQILEQFAVGFQIRLPAPHDPRALVLLVGRVAAAGVRT